MKKRNLLLVLLLSFLLMSCSEEESVSLDFYDPQQIEFTSIIDTALINAFGVENIHFGHTPPNLDSISFHVDGMDYVVHIRYLFDENGEPFLPPHQNTGAGEYDPTENYHLFHNQKENIASHILLTKGTHGPEDIHLRQNDTVYIIGSGNDFTAYYEEQLQSTGHPVNGILVSGTLSYDQTGKFLGIKDYRLGKKILRYTAELPPVAQVYAQGTIEIKEHLTLSPVFDPHTCQLWIDHAHNPDNR